MKKLLLTTAMIAATATTTVSASEGSHSSIVRTVLMGVIGYQFGGTHAATIASAATGVALSTTVGPVKAPKDCPIGAVVEGTAKIVTAPILLVGKILGVK
jgi:hypothetical protein